MLTFRALALRICRQKANARNVSFQFLYGGQFTVLTPLINPNFCGSYSKWNNSVKEVCPSFLKRYLLRNLDRHFLFAWMHAEIN